MNSLPDFGGIGPAVRFHSVLLPFQKLQADLTRLYDIHWNLHFEIHSLQNTNPAVCYHLKEAAAKVLDSINLLKSYRRQRHLALHGSFHNFFSHHGRMPAVSSFLGMARERAGIDLYDPSPRNTWFGCNKCKTWIVSLVPVEL